MFTVKKVLSYLKPYKIAIIIAYSFTFLEITTVIQIPILQVKMINEFLTNLNINSIIFWGSIMLGISCISLFVGILNSYFASHTSNGFSYDIREKLFNKIQSFSFTNLNQYPTAGLVTRFTDDVRQIQNTIFMGLRIMVRAPLMVVGGVFMAFYINFKLASIFLITVPLLIFFLFWVLKKAGNMFKQVQERVDTVNRVMQENLSGMRLIKAFLRRAFEENRFIKANKELATKTRSTFRFVEGSMPVLLFVMNLSLIFIID